MMLQKYLNDKNEINYLFPWFYVGAVTRIVKQFGKLAQNRCP